MNMKHSIIVIAMFAIACCVVFAANPLADPKVAPMILLPDAYRQAMTALGSATNTFHCTKAEWQSLGFWEFSFYNTNGGLKTVDGDRVIDGERPVF